MAPLRVAGLMEFHVLETEPLMLLTYCMPQKTRPQPSQETKEKASNPEPLNKRGGVGQDEGRRREEKIIHGAHG
jgi:hypothetical protein